MYVLPFGKLNRPDTSITLPGYATQRNIIRNCKISARRNVPRAPIFISATNFLTRNEIHFYIGNIDARAGGTTPFRITIQYLKLCQYVWRAFLERILNNRFGRWFFINGNQLGHFRRARPPYSREWRTKQRPDKFHFSKCAGFIPVAFTIVFGQTKTRECTAIAESIWKNALSAGRIFIGACVTKFAHKL